MTTVNEVAGFITTTTNAGYLNQLYSTIASRLQTLGVPADLVNEVAIPPVSFRAPIQLDYVRLAGGSVFFVNSTNTTYGSDASGYGQTPEAPFLTIAYALLQCTAAKGDLIVVMPGHAEAISTANGIDFPVSSIEVLGLGNGTNKPTLTWGTATTATLRFNANNCKLRNFRCVGNIDDLAMFISDNAEHTTIEDCEFVTSSTKEAISFIQKTTTKDYLTVRRCRFEQPTDPAGTDGGAGTGCFYCVDSEHIYFEDCHFWGNFETAIFHNRTTACKDLWVRNCTGIQLLSGAEPFQLVAGATGAMSGGGMITPAETAATEATLVGTLGDAFFILQPGAFGNDGGAGGQGGIVVTAAS